MSPNIQLTQGLLDELRNRVDSEHPDIESVIGSLLETSGGKLIGDPFYAYTCSKEFKTCGSDSERYITLLGKLHELHRVEFGDFVAGQRLRRRYFGQSKEEICQASKHNQARQIPNSKYWAIMNIDAPTKKRFLKRLLVYIGYSDEMVTHARSLIGRS